MELEKFLMNEKAQLPASHALKQKLQTTKTNFENLRLKNQLQSVSIFFQLNAPFCVSCVIYVTGQNHIQV